MLLALHAALLADLTSPLARALMTTHLGLFFLWQPIWQRERKLDWPPVLLIIAFSATFVGVLNGWLVFAWLILLVGIVAGRTRTGRRERYALMLALAFLISELLINVAPQIFPIATIDPAIPYIFKRGLLVVPLILAFLPPAQSTPRQTYPIEFFGGIIVALITALLAVGSVLLSTLRALPYPAALFVALIAVAGFLVFISWLIAPSTGSGLGALWEQSVLNIGTPFEAWMTNLAALADHIATPADFLTAALEGLAQTPWVRGARWSAQGVSGHAGTETSRSTQITTEHLGVILYLDHPLGPTLLLHCRLLVETVSHFYAAKAREQEQSHQAHMRAIFETGARLTHDIKNLLQSLKLLTTAITTSSAGDAERLQLLQRQLPLITSRLQTALDKLNEPADATGEFITLKSWWEHFCTRHAGGGLELHASFDDTEAVAVADCLDSVVENLIDNARHKQRAGEALQIAVQLHTERGHFMLTVTDTGAPLPGELAESLFKHALPSAQGFGIGLYQAFHQAARVQLSLQLAENRAGCVRFAFGNMAEEAAP